jgi:uncharacterized protein (DUF885 family)
MAAVTGRRLALIAGIVLLAACRATPEPGAAPASAPAQAQVTLNRLNALYAEFWEASLQLNPLLATYLGDTRYNDQLPDFYSPGYRARVSAFNRDWLARVRAVDAAALSGQDRLSYDIFIAQLEEAIEGERFPGWQQPLNQFYSFPNQFVMLGSGTNAQPFRTVKDYDDWLARAGQLPTLFESAMAAMREGMKHGVVQPRVLMEKVLPQLDALIHERAEDTLFWKPVAAMPAALRESDGERLETAYRALIETRLLPAYRDLRRFVAEDYLPKARDSHGLGALPGGADWYAYNVRQMTTTELSPETIHQIGLDEVARIHGEMRKVMVQMGFEGDLQAFFAYMTSDPRFEFASEEAMLAYYRNFEAQLDPKLDAMFSLQPKAAFEIRPVEPFRAASAAGGSYQPPAEDGSRPGVFYLNTYDLPSRKTWDMQALYLHEAKPGHHFQIALQQELTGLPTFRRYGRDTAYIEGWGLYAEYLGEELGAYDTPEAYFGRLQAELWRAIRLVVDTGLHAKGWTREQVIAYMRENSATTETEAVAETERYMALPGQALAYKLGELKLKELRARAEAALGERFDLRAFHAEVLESGSLPLAVLEAKIERWIAAQG